MPTAVYGAWVNKSVLFLLVEGATFLALLFLREIKFVFFFKRLAFFMFLQVELWYLILLISKLQRLLLGTIPWQLEVLKSDLLKPDAMQANDRLYQVLQVAAIPMLVGIVFCFFWGFQLFWVSYLVALCGGILYSSNAMLKAFDAARSIAYVQEAMLWIAVFITQTILHALYFMSE